MADRTGKPAILAALATAAPPDGPAPSTGSGADAGAKDGAPPKRPRGRPPGPARSDRPRARDWDILAYADRHAFLWHSPDGTAYINLPEGEVRENYEVVSEETASHFSETAYRETGETLGAAAIDKATRVLVRRARREGPQIKPWVRVGGAAGKIFVDVVDKPRHVIEVTAHNVETLVDDGSIDAGELPFLPFVRKLGMLPMPEYDIEGTIDELRPFCNVAEEADFIVVAGLLAICFRPGYPYPITILNGQQGSGKSTFSSVLRSIVDPSSVPIQMPPKVQEDITVAARNLHMLTIDNMSFIDGPMADRFCSIATGVGTRERELFKNKTEVLSYILKPILLNGIPTLTNRPDLADRSITLQLRRLGPEERVEEQTHEQAWKRAHPKVLGAVLVAVSAALRTFEEVKATIGPLPRMAGAVAWAESAMSGYGIERGRFLEAFVENQDLTSVDSFEADPLAVAVSKLVKEGGMWVGSAAELLADVENLVSENTKRSKAWPQTSQGVGVQLQRIAPVLMKQGFTVDKRRGHARSIRITRAAAPEPEAPTS